jgi:hypothetical protein
VWNGSRGDAKALAKMMTKNVVVYGGASKLAVPKSCPYGVTDDDRPRAKAADCVAGLLKHVDASAMTNITVEPIGSTSEYTLPSPPTSRVLHVNSDALELEIVVEKHDGKTQVIATRVYVGTY